MLQQFEANSPGVPLGGAERNVLSGDRHDHRGHRRPTGRVQRSRHRLAAADFRPQLELVVAECRARTSSQFSRCVLLRRVPFVSVES